MAGAKEPKINGIEIKALPSQDPQQISIDKLERFERVDELARAFVRAASRLSNVTVGEFTVGMKGPDPKIKLENTFKQEAAIRQVIEDDLSGKKEGRLKIAFVTKDNKPAGDIMEFEITPESLREAIKRLDAAAQAGSDVRAVIQKTPEMKENPRKINVRVIPVMTESLKPSAPSR